jgi:thiamine-monophosphate kinase
MKDSRPQLGDMGERRVVREILTARYGGRGNAFGDDCATVLVTPAGVVVATTDPAPRPVAQELGFDDPYYWGWLLAALNLSDLAAAGATPAGLLTSLTLPSSTSVDDFKRLLDGIDDCCAASDTMVIGGNLKESTDGKTRCEAMALGMAEGGPPMGRTGARPGDAVVAFGATGCFWAAVLTHLEKGSLHPTTDHEFLDALLRPRPLVDLGRRLRLSGLARACTDASDGLYAAVNALTVDQGLGCVLGEDWRYPDAVRRAASRLGVDPFRLALGFGDLQLVCVIRPDELGRAEREAAVRDTHMIVLGHVVVEPQVRLRRTTDTIVLANFDNERFTEESQFTGGLAAYRQRLLTRPLGDRMA